MMLSLGYHPAMEEDLHHLTKVYERLGAEVLRVPSKTTDAVFHRDVVAWTPSGLIQCRMGKESRRWEPEDYFQSMKTFEPSFGFTRGNEAFEGADLMFVGIGLNVDYPILATGRRTNNRGAAVLSAWLMREGYETYRVNLPHWHDQHLLGVSNCVGDVVFVLKSLMPSWEAALPEDTLLVPLPDEEYELKCANWVVVDDSVVINEQCTRTIGLLSAYSNVIPVPIESLLAHGGGVACATGVLSL